MIFFCVVAAHNEDKEDNNKIFYSTLPTLEPKKRRISRTKMTPFIEENRKGVTETKGSYGDYVITLRSLQ